MELETLIDKHFKAIELLKSIEKYKNLIAISRAKIMKSRDFFYRTTIRENDKIKKYKSEINELRLAYTNLITNNNTKTPINYEE